MRTVDGLMTSQRLSVSLSGAPITFQSRWLSYGRSKAAILASN
jgi:hypothetical protein